MIIYKNKSIINNNVTVVNYSNELYTNSQKNNVKTALSVGKVKRVISFSNKDIDEVFYSENKSILEEHRGGGYWLWKPYIIRKALLEIEENEILFYCDSGSFFIDSIEKMIGLLENQDIIPFELQQNDKYWTKKDAFVLMDSDSPYYYQTKQRLASYCILKKTNFTMNFVNEWLLYACDKRILTDIDNTLGLPNYEGFIEHRHDQSIFSLLTKKYLLKPYRDPSQFGNNYKELYPECVYEQIIVSTRQKNVSLLKKLKKNIKPYMSDSLLKLYKKLKF